MTRLLLLCAIYYHAIMHGIQPEVAVAQVFVESSFRPQVVNKGCYGLMQVDIRIWKKALKIDERRMLEPFYNLDIGLDILRHYYDQTGSITHALQHFNCGPSGKYKSDYVQKIKAAYRKIYRREMCY
jgi:soluble lytic murein transglycosylase-like protein